MNLRLAFLVLSVCFFIHDSALGQVKRLGEKAPKPNTAAPSQQPKPQVDAPKTNASAVKASATVMPPTEVTLTKAVEFPVLLNGKQVGSAQVPAGTVLKLLKRQGDSVMVEHKNLPVTIPADSTDYQGRMEKYEAAKAEVDRQAAAEKQAKLFEQEKAKEREELAKKCRSIAGNIIQVTEQGLLTQTFYYRDTVKEHYVSVPMGRGGSYLETRTSPGPAERVDGPVILIGGHPKAKQFVDGDGVSFYGYQEGTRSYRGTDGAQRTVQRWIYLSDEGPKK